MSRLAAVFTLLAAGCHASVSADAQMNQELDAKARASAQTDANEPGAEGASHARPLSAEQAARSRALANATPETALETDFALFGARHDFSVKDASGAMNCQCVSALLGPPSSGKLEWRGEMPRVKPETQLMLALVPGACSDGGAGASYWGYRVEGDDVVVLLEAWKSGRPRTLGAIIPKPAGAGQVYLAPVTAGAPYGRQSNGNGNRCPLGNPGPRRTTPLDSSSSEAAP